MAHVGLYISNNDALMVECVNNINISHYLPSELTNINTFHPQVVDRVSETQRQLNNIKYL